MFNTHTHPLLAVVKEAWDHWWGARGMLLHHQGMIVNKQAVDCVPSSSSIFPRSLVAADICSISLD